MRSALCYKLMNHTSTLPLTDSFSHESISKVIKVCEICIYTL